jgi:hypothetical protein
MFSKIPQKLTAPFGLLGDEAKLSFRSQPTGILKLTSTRVRPASSTSVLLLNLFVRTSLKTMPIGTRQVNAMCSLVVNSHGDFLVHPAVRFGFRRLFVDNATRQ